MDKKKNEVIHQKIDNVEFQIRVEPKNPESQVLKGSGKLYLTNYKLYLINTKQNKQFKGFETKSYKVYQEKLEQPTFGQNFFQGQVSSYNKIFRNDLEFKVIFKSGNQS